MPWNLHKNKDDKVIEVYLRGQVNFDELVQARTRIAELCRKNNYRLVMVDTSQSELSLEISAMDLFEFGTDVLKKANMPSNTRNAVIILPGTKSSKDWRFLETVEANRGFNIKSFANQEKAVEWLMRK